MATFLPFDPSKSSVNPLTAYAQLLSAGGILALICLLSFALLVLRRKQLDCLKRFDLFADYHEPPPHAAYLPLPYPTRLGGMCSLWAVILLLTYATYLSQQFFSASNTLTQQSLAVFDDSLWMPPLAWSTAAPPWGAGVSGFVSGLQLRLLISGQPEACAAPQSWSAQGQGAGEWSLVSTPSCATPLGSATAIESAAVSQHVFSCPSCVLGDASALSTIFAFSCQAVAIEAIAVPSFPVGSLSTRRADINATTLAHHNGLLASITWTLRITPTQLQDNSKSLLPWTNNAETRGRSPLGYLLSSQQLATTRIPLASSLGYSMLQPASRAVNISIMLPLQSFVAVTQLTPIMNFAALLAQLVGITGLLGGFRVAFGVAEMASKKFTRIETGASDSDNKESVGANARINESMTLRQRTIHSREGQGPEGAPGPTAPLPGEDLPAFSEGLGLWTPREVKVLPIQPSEEALSSQKAAPT